MWVGMRVYGRDRRSNITGLYTEVYKSQQQRQTDTDKSSYSEEKMVQCLRTLERIPAYGGVSGGTEK